MKSARVSDARSQTLRDIYASHDGKVSDKWSSYLDAYERFFAPFRDKPVRLLEIGVQNGGSLEIWREYFPRAKVIVGCDINPDCEKLTFSSKKIALIVGDANSEEGERQILARSPQFDIIIDDGSHISSDIIRSFARYFPHLADGGIYIAEDLHCSYWQSFEGGLYAPYSAMTFFKRLADVINSEHWGIAKNRESVFRGVSSHSRASLADHILERVHSVHFENSLCAIRSEQPEKNRLGQRMISGKVAKVVPAALNWHTRPVPLTDQSSNEWTSRDVPPEEELPLRIRELDEQRATIAALQARVAEIELENSSHIATVAELRGELANAVSRKRVREAEVRAHAKRLRELKAKLELSEKARAAILKTWSWKLTAPLRILSIAAKSLKILINTTPKAIYIGGGLRTTIVKAWRVLRKEGVVGVKNRLDCVRATYPSSSIVIEPAQEQNKAPKISEIHKSTYNGNRPYNFLSFDHISETGMQYIVNRETKNYSDVAFFTAISSSYDGVNFHEHLISHADYYLFSDIDIERFVFKTRTLPYIDEDPVRSARFVKTHSHMLFPNHRIAIWLDGNILIRGDLSSLIDRFERSGLPIAAVPHPLRASVYEEAQECIKRKKDDPAIIEAQMARYRAEGFRCSDLVESNFMMFRLDHPKLAPFLATWWREIERGSRRDQLSLNYAMQEAGITWFPLTERPNSVRNHPDLALFHHGSNRYPYEPKVFTNKKSKQSYSDVIRERVREQSHRKVDVVVCVHNAIDDVKLCLESVVATRNEDKHRIIIVDDGSDSETRSWLNGFHSSHSNVNLIRNDLACGYTKAANAGLRAMDADVAILLNSDTITAGFWIEKLLDAMYSNAGVGIVGPLSSAASHQSIPNHKSSAKQTAINDLPAGYTTADMNEWCEKNSPADFIPRVPLVHGFCFAVRREVVQKVGFFDEKNFPFGYGEENDYCFRAVDAGFSLAVATNTYIYHKKSQSYQDEKRAALVHAGNMKIREIYGKERVLRAVRSMQANPYLERMREMAISLFAH